MKEADIHLPIVAIGGITLEDIPSIMETGITDIALSGTILLSLIHISTLTLARLCSTN